MGLKAAVQALKKAEALKDKVQRCKDLLHDNDAWIWRQQLQKIYQQVLILDLEYALDKKVEQELWNLGFKNYIAMLQSQAKDKKNPKRGESQALLSWCLEAASGFYLTLLQEICTAFDLDLPFRRKGYVYGCTSPWKAVEKLSAPHKSSCFYACQYCLVHLGDIARYRNENKQAELFYRHAVSLSPSSGQPYNQLALLEASRGDKLGTVFHYARSVAVKHPFPVATANLSKTLSSTLNDNSFNICGKTKLNSQEYITVFLKLHGILHNLGDLKVASSYVKLLTETLTALVATESFSSWRLVQMLVVNLYALQHTAGASIDNSELLKLEQLSKDEKIARDYLLDLIAGSLSALLLPVYTIKSSIIEYFALPSIKLCLEWIRIKPSVLEEIAFTSKLQIWPSLCVLLNALQNCVNDFNYDQYCKVPLPEDRDLQGFLPLEKSFEHLRFTNTELEGDVTSLNKLRAVRMLHLGQYFTQQQIGGCTLISVSTTEKRFICMSETAGPSNELMKELEELSLSKDKQSVMPASFIPSEIVDTKGSTELDAREQEKRIGILKPQSSLERSRDTVVCPNSESTNIDSSTLPLTRKIRQNVAMQAIMRRAENEQKQVTFKNVSPIIVEENDKKARPLVSPIKINGMKNTSGITETPVLDSISNQNIQVIIQNRQPAAPGGTTGLPPTFSQCSAKNSVQNQLIPMQDHLKSVNMQVNVSQLPQVAQPSAKDQNLGISQFGQQAQTLPSICYQNQSFNVQNPQFAKHFMMSIQQIPQSTVQQFQMSGQFNNASHGVPQNIVTQSNTQSQNRPLHQRTNQPVPQNSLVQHSMGATNSAQQNHRVMATTSHNIALQQPVAIAQQSLNMQQQSISVQQRNHALGLQQQRMEMQSNLQTNGTTAHIQLNANGTNVMNTLPVVSAIPAYQKSLEQLPSMSTSANSSLNSAKVSNYQLSYNQNFNPNAYNHVSQKQLSPTVYRKNSVVDFPFPSQNNISKTQQQTSNNYPIFQNYETQEFGLWKDTQSSQLPMAWWNTAETPGGVRTHTKDTSLTDTFRNWSNSPKAGTMIGRVPSTPGNNYLQNSMQGRQSLRSNFDDTRSFEVDQNPVLPTSTGNTYSLFSGNTWSTGSQTTNASAQDELKTRLNQQSLWSGPGPSPLERLLEQQKSLREGGT